VLNPIVPRHSAGKVDTAMPESAAPSSARPWHVIAAEAACEEDPVKLGRLVKELTHALDQQRPPKPKKETKQLENA
jgi:hypothetical protein